MRKEQQLKKAFRLRESMNPIPLQLRSDVQTMRSFILAPSHLFLHPYPPLQHSDGHVPEQALCSTPLVYDILSTLNVPQTVCQPSERYTCYMIQFKVWLLFSSLSFFKPNQPPPPFSFTGSWTTYDISSLWLPFIAWLFPSARLAYRSWHIHKFLIAERKWRGDGAGE